MTMTTHLRTAALSLATGGALALLGLLVGADSASAAPVGIDLDATTGSTVLPGRATPVPVWGYCRRSAADTPCGTVDAPGGPTLVVTAGDVVTITLHNRLAEASSLQVGGQAQVPDVAGAAAGGTKTYTFTASRPGTYLYEAGLTPNSQHQVAMGLYGALVVKPDTAGQAYDASTAYDAESVLVLGEVDPALNDAGNKATFDMRGFKARWSLINGKAHPDTAPVPAASGQKLLLRWVNAGTSYHSMGVLGADQRVVALDGSQLANGGTDTSRRYVAETFGPGQTADAIVTVPTTPTDRRLAVYDTSLSLHNSTLAGTGGMLTFVAVTGAGGGTDTTGPATTGVAWAAGTLTATVSDVATGNATVSAAEYHLDSIAAAPVAMAAVMAPFDAPTEAVTAAVPIPSGQHVLYVRGRDSLGSWGTFSSVLVMGADDQGPTTSAVALDPGATNGSVAVAVSATGNDSASGNSAVTGGEWSVDSGVPTAMTVATTGPVADLRGSIPQSDVNALAEGTHQVAVRTQDSHGNWGATATAQLVIDKHGPAASAVTVTPNPNNGQKPVNASTSAVRLSATLTDVDTVSPVVRGEAFIDTLGAPGTGIVMQAADGAFSTPTENAYLDIPLASVRQMTDGNHTLYVRGKDAAGSWGAAASTVLKVDKTGPAITGLTLTPNPTNGAGTVTLTASVTDPLSSIASAEWFLGADPGVGNGAALSIGPGGTGGPVSATVIVATLPEGNVPVTIRARDALGNTSSAVGQLQVRHPLWFSTSGNVNPPGVAGTADDSDVYGWSGSAFSRALDLSAAPYSVPTTANVDGYSRAANGTFYVSFKDAVTLPVLGTVQDEDVVLWNGSRWTMYFDGSLRLVGSTDLDAISVVGGQLYFSTDTNTNPNQVGGTADDSDIYRWNGGSGYTRVVDATTVGIPAGANADGFVWRSGTDYLFSFGADTTVTGLGAVQDEDIVRRTSSTWFVYLDGTARNLTDPSLDVDAFDIP